MNFKSIFLVMGAFLVLPGGEQAVAGKKDKETAVYFVRIEGRNEGPLTRSELVSRYGSGDITHMTPVWGPGLNSWMRIFETNLIPEQAIRASVAKRGRTPANTPVPPPFPDDVPPAVEPARSDPPDSGGGLRGYLRALGGMQGGLTFPYPMQFTFGGELGIRTPGKGDIGIHVTTLSASEYLYTASKTQLSLSYTGGGEFWYVGGRFGFQLISLSDGFTSFTSDPYFFTSPVVGLRIPLGGGRVRETVSFDIEVSTVGAFTDTFTLDFQSMAGLRLSF
jgi:hypothetical protein